MKIDFSLGLHIVGFLASHTNELVSSSIMAESFGTSPIVLRRVLARLNQSGLVETKRGANGGSKLARSAKDINLKQVFDAACLTPELFARHPQGDGIVSDILGGYINEFYLEAEKVMLAHLASTSVADMDDVVRPQIMSMLNCKPGMR